MNKWVTINTPRCENEGEVVTRFQLPIVKYFSNSSMYQHIMSGKKIVTICDGFNNVIAAINVNSEETTNNKFLALLQLS